jgi:hypothetical protein
VLVPWARTRSISPAVHGPVVRCGLRATSPGRSSSEPFEG